MGISVTTLAVMKARVASETRRSNLTSQIASAISSAIAAYEDERLTFTESREITFSTVIGQAAYGSSDSALIGRLEKIDYVRVIISDYPREVLETEPGEIETLNRNGTATGEPLRYCYYGQKLRFAYVPSTVWTIRVGGVLRVPEPAADAETDNPWMTTAERAVRCRAKYELYEHVLMDAEKARTFNPENVEGPTYEAARQLRRRAVHLQGGSMTMAATQW